MIVGRSRHREALAEQVVLFVVEGRHEWVWVEGEEVYLSCLHSIAVLRQNDAALTGLCADEIALLEGIGKSIFIQFGILPKGQSVFHLHISTVFLNCTPENLDLPHDTLWALTGHHSLLFEVKFNDAICLQDDGGAIWRVKTDELRGPLIL